MKDTQVNLKPQTQIGLNHIHSEQLFTEKVVEITSGIKIDTYTTFLESRCISCGEIIYKIKL